MFDSAAGSVNDLFAGVGSIMQGDIKAKGLDISAEGLQLKAQGDLAEATNYDLASSLALKNEDYTKTSTAIQQLQQTRSNYLQVGGQEAAIAGAGFAASGSSLDILADSARQGALAKEVIGQQGLINEAGYEEQAQSYQTMASAARTAAAGEEQMAGETRSLASETQTAGIISGVGDFISGAIKAAPMVAAVMAL